MRMFIEDLFVDNDGVLKPLRPYTYSTETSYPSAKEAQRQLLQRFHDRGVTKYKNGIELPDNPIKGMTQRVWFEGA